MKLILFLDIVYSIAVTPDNSQLVAAYRDRKVKFFDLQTKSLVYELEQIHRGKILL